MTVAMRHLRVVFLSAVGESPSVVALQASLRSLGVDFREVYALTHIQYRGEGGASSALVRRLRVYVLFPIKALIAAWRIREPAVFVASTNPFLLPLALTLLGPSRHRYIALYYDLYPEALVEAGLIGESSLLAQCLRRLNKVCIGRADGVVFIGEYLSLYVQRKYGKPRNCCVIHVGAQPMRNREVAASSGSGKVVVLYSGQCGRMHEVETVISGVGCSLPKGVDLVFRVSGIGRSRLEEAFRDKPGCTVAGPLGEREWSGLMTSAAVALVTVKDGAERVVMPSKTYSALAAGQAVLAVCNANSDLARIVALHDCGWVVTPGDSSEFARVMKEIAERPDVLLKKRGNGLRAFDLLYTSDVVACRWREFLQEVAADTEHVTRRG